MSDYTHLSVEQQRAQYDEALTNVESQLLSQRINRLVNSQYPSADVTALEVQIAALEQGREALRAEVAALPPPASPS